LIAVRKDYGEIEEFLTGISPFVTAIRAGNAIAYAGATLL
jgi:hypothetical protein